MIAILLADKPEKIRSVYGLIDFSLPPFNFQNINFYTKMDIINSDKTKFEEVKYIFSTWYMPVFTEREISEYFPSLEVIFYAAGTVKYFAEPFLKSGIKVYSAAKANGIAVAEFAAAQIILANKGYFQAQNECKKKILKKSFDRTRSYAISRGGNYKTKIGIIGLGAIGTQVVQLLKPYELDIYVTDPYVSSEKIYALKVKRMELSKLFETCDVISNHLPDTSETKKILDYSLFTKMKSTATFINTGRGAQVNEKGLAKALREKKYRCAVLDVTAHEPLWPWNSLRWLKNVFISPHIAGSLSNEEHRMADYMRVAYKDYLAGRKNESEVTLEMLKTMA